jgi:TolB-like protein/Flp pilus assembly protein TadD
MSEQAPRRRLAAILAADVVGYSAMMQADEAGTLAALKSRRREILQPLVGKHHGRIVKLMGDGVLVEFGSAVNAVACAVELQKRMAAENDGLPEERCIALRVGINLGDVIIEGGDLYGDGVNIAARLQEKAEPGGILVSGTTYDHVRNKVDAGFDDLGTQALKNIAEPVRIYGVAGTPTAAAPMPKPASDKPSIAVLPFTNMSDDREQEYFSDGITEDIITELSRFHSLFVIARISSNGFKSRSMKVQDIARELGVAYIVEGSVRRDASRVRINAQLIDAGSGNHLWAERYDRDMRDIFVLQDEVAHAVASTVSGRVEAAGRDRAVRLGPTTLRAYDLVLRAKALTAKYTKADNAQALVCAERAVELDPTSARAHSHAAWCHFFDHMAWWVVDRENSLAKAYELAQRAVVLDETDSFAHCILGAVHMFRREYNEARSEIERAIDLNPNDPDARRYYGNLLGATGNANAGIEQMDLAKRLNPFDTRWVPWIRGIACFTARRYDEAIAAFRQARNPINEVRGWLAASYAQAGRLQEARATLEEFLRVAESDMTVFPGRRLKDWEPYWHGAFEYQDQQDFDHLFDALRKAGLPE